MHDDTCVQQRNSAQQSTVKKLSCLPNEVNEQEFKKKMMMIIKSYCQQPEQSQSNILLPSIIIIIKTRIWITTIFAKGEKKVVRVIQNCSV